MLFSRLVCGQQPLPQRQHDERGTGQNRVFIGRRAQQQVVDLAAGADARAEQQIHRCAHAREPAACGLFDAAERSQQKQPRKQNHRQARRQVAHGGQCFKRKLEQKARNNAKIDVVAALVVSNIPQGIGRGLLTGGSIIGVRHLLHRGGRVLFKIQTAVEQAVRQSAVLGSGVAGPIVNM